MRKWMLSLVVPEHLAAAVVVQLSVQQRPRLTSQSAAENLIMACNASRFNTGLGLRWSGFNFLRLLRMTQALLWFGHSGLF